MTMLPRLLLSKVQFFLMICDACACTGWTHDRCMRTGRGAWRGGLQRCTAGAPRPRGTRPGRGAPQARLRPRRRATHSAGRQVSRHATTRHGAGREACVRTGRFSSTAVALRAARDFSISSIWLSSCLSSAVSHTSRSV